MDYERLSLRDKHRLEWENKVISYINMGSRKSDAQIRADENLEDKYCHDEDPGE